MHLDNASGQAQHQTNSVVGDIGGAVVRHVGGGNTAPAGFLDVERVETHPHADDHADVRGPVKHRLIAAEPSPDHQRLGGLPGLGWDIVQVGRLIETELCPVAEYSLLNICTTGIARVGHDNDHEA